jgi:hypothetical protein
MKNTKQNENISNDESLISLQRLILIELRKSVDGKFEHLLILDDVTEETKHSCKKLKDSLLKLEVKIIATTWNSAFCDSRFFDDDNLTILSISDKGLPPFKYLIKRFGVICDDLIQVLAPYNAIGR